MSQVTKEIEFFDNKSGVIAEDPYLSLFVYGNSVYQRSWNTFESQCSVIGFDDFIEERLDLDWRVKST